MHRTGSAAVSAMAATILTLLGVATVAAAIIYGTDGNDQLYGTPAADTIYARKGHDRVLGYQGGDFLLGGTGDDRIRGGPGQDVIRGAVGDDRLYGGPGFDNVHGEGGNDTIFVNGDGVADHVNCGSGIDVVYRDPDETSFSCETKITVTPSP